MNLQTRESMTGYLFAMPWIVGFFGLALGPMIVSFLLAFIRWDGISTETIAWVGLGNYARAAADPDVAIALWNTAWYSFISVPLGLAVALILALLLNQPLRGIALFRTIFYMPALVGGVATIMMWLWVFNPEYGLLNSVLLRSWHLLAALGLEQAADWPLPKWIFSDLWAKPALILMSLWGTGASMLIFLAALQNVPESLYEAAELDGAGPWRKFAFVTIPQISPALFFNLVMGIIGSFQVFTSAFIMTKGGPANATYFFVLGIYLNAFQFLKMGYASALGWMLAAIILVLTLLAFRSSGRWVHYEGQIR